MGAQAVSADLDDVKESLEHTIHVLNGILEDVKKGAYTQKEAELDVENLLFTEGLDFVSILQEYAFGTEEKK